MYCISCLYPYSALHISHRTHLLVHAFCLCVMVFARAPLPFRIAHVRVETDTYFLCLRLVAGFLKCTLRSVHIVKTLHPNESHSHVVPALRTGTGSTRQVVGANYPLHTAQVRQAFSFAVNRAKRAVHGTQFFPSPSLQPFSI